MGLWDTLKTIAKVGSNFIPGVGPFVSAGLTMADMLGNPADSMKTYGSSGYSNPYMPASSSSSGDSGTSGFFGKAWDWAKENPQYSVPLGLGAVQGLAGIPSALRQGEMDRGTITNQNIQNDLLNMVLSRKKQMQPAYDKAASMVPDILSGQGPVMSYLGGLKDKPKTFAPSVQDKLRMYLEG